MNTWITLWLADAQHFTTAEFLKTPGVAATFSLLEPGSFTGDLVWALPALRFQGVETSLLNQLVTFASGIWPSYNWAADLNQPCTQGGLTVTCK
jgi:hypothetical protein